VLWLLVAFPALSAAEELLMARVARPFPETMNALQEAIRGKGYTVSRVQRVDVGLTSSGFQTAEYRLVFYAVPEELRSLSRDHVELIPYLPLSIVIFAEGDDTIILTANPQQLGEFFDRPELRRIFSRWEQDVRTVFDGLTKSP
jgi:uncharacterized protein (DUF302 family)